MCRPTSMTPELEAPDPLLGRMSAIQVREANTPRAVCLDEINVNAKSSHGNLWPHSMILIGVCSNDAADSGYVAIWADVEGGEKVGIYSPLCIVLKVYVYNYRPPLSDCDHF